MSLSRALLICGAAVLALLAALPMTRWVVQNHLDMMAGRYQLFSSESMWNSGNDFYSDQLERLEPSSADAEFILAWRKGPADVLAVAQRQPESPALYAHAARAASIKKDHVVRPNHDPLVIQAAKAGRNIDPNNGYFHMVLAGALEASGDTQAALAALAEASRAPRFDGYWTDHAEREIRARESQFGYRGEYVRLFSYAGIVMPEFSSFNLVCEAVQKQDSLEARRHLAKAGLLMVRESDTLIGTLVGRRMITFAILRQGEKLSRLKVDERDAVFKERALERDRQAGTTEFTDALEQSEFTQQVLRDLPDDTWMWNRWPTVYAACALATLGLLVLTCLLAVPLAKRETGAGVERAMPHILAFAAWMLAQFGLTRLLETPGSEAESIVGLLMLLHWVIAAGYAESRWGRLGAVVAASVHALISIVASIPYVPLGFGIGLAAASVATLVGITRIEPARRVQFGTAIGVSASLLALIVASWAPVAGIPAAAFLVGLLATRAKLAVPMLVVVVAALGYLVITMTRTQSDPILSLLGLGVGIFAVAFYWRKSLTAQPLTPVLLIVFATIAYVIGVGAELGQNGKDRVMLKNYLNEADRARERAR